MNDLISRQAAIEYFMTNMNWYDEDGYESDEDYKRACITELINGVPSAQPGNCEGCKHLGKWENEVECGYPSPCTRCKRRVEDHYER